MHANTPLAPTPIDVCTDCVTVLANGVDDDAETLTATAVRLSDAWPGETPTTTPAVTLGRMDDVDGDPPAGPHFSWQPCDGCGSTLGGDRHPATGWFDPEGHR